MYALLNWVCTRAAKYRFARRYSRCRKLFLFSLFTSFTAKDSFRTFISVKQSKVASCSRRQRSNRSCPPLRRCLREQQSAKTRDSAANRATQFGIADFNDKIESVSDERE